jgi:endonuclease III related protein
MSSELLAPSNQFEGLGSQLEFGLYPVSVERSNPETVKPEENIRSYFQTLYDAWGQPHWWPAQSRFEVIVGAYLTQNTSWTNVERALDSLRNAHVLSVRGIRRTPLPKLEKLIRSSGYFRQKAQRLKTFVRFLDERYGGSLARMFAQATEKLRAELLALSGVGPETADSILLYAGNHPVFVVDAYTRRILERHQLIPAKASYEEIRQLFERALAPVAEEDTNRARETRATIPATEKIGSVTSAAKAANKKTVLIAALKRCATPNRIFSAACLIGPPGSCHPPSPMSRAARTPAAQVFNEMHGLIVGVGKNYCKKSQIRCEQCPLQKFLPAAKIPEIHG